MFLILLLSLFTGPLFAAPHLDLNDVSVLFPLPGNDQWSLLPAGETEAAKGQLLPKSYVTQLPVLLQGTENEKLYPSLRAVGFRIDP